MATLLRRRCQSRTRRIRARQKLLKGDPMTPSEEATELVRNVLLAQARISLDMDKPEAFKEAVAKVAEALTLAHAKGMEEAAKIAEGHVNALLCGNHAYSIA